MTSLEQSPFIAHEEDSLAANFNTSERGLSNNEDQPKSSFTKVKGNFKGFLVANKKSLSTLFVIMFVFYLLFVCFMVVVAFERPNTRKNVIFMVSDGFGPTSETFGREMLKYYLNKTNEHDYKTVLDQILVGQIRTKSSDSLVTDSAAGATAFACGIKTYNTGIAVYPDGQKKCGTILEAAKEKGYLTGLVVTSRITHATPAAFSAHVKDRDMESEIAQQQILGINKARYVDLMFGGGLCFFKPSSSNNSCRNDNMDLIKEAKSKKWNYSHKLSGFNKLKPTEKLPLINLMSEGHMEYEIDRDKSEQPSLKEMTVSALSILKSNSKKGFFMLVEGSRIDMAAHNNDPVAHAHEIMAYYEAVEAVKSFVAKNKNTILISTSDHETGGLTLGRNNGGEYPQYKWSPEVIAKCKMSAKKLAQKLINYKSTRFNPKKLARYYLQTIKQYWSLSVSLKQVEQMLDIDEVFVLARFLGKLISKEATIGWTTIGHTAADVNLYAFGTDSQKLTGNIENTDINKFMEAFLETDQKKVTDTINS